MTEEVWAQVHSGHSKPREVDQTVLLRIRTATLDASMERETQMEWKVGTQDQLVSALERAVMKSRIVEKFTVWSVSDQAFGSQGSSRAGIPARTPLRFDVEVIPF